VPEILEDAVSRRGDIWQLGKISFDRHENDDKNKETNCEPEFQKPIFPQQRDI